jgi:hypothetical protein
MMLSLAVAVLAFLQTPATSAKIVFAFEEGKSQPSAYTLEINENGAGHFRSTAASAPASASEDEIAPGAIDQDIQINDPLLSHFFSVARTNHFFAVECEIGHGNIAFTGKKTFTYSGPDGQGSCTYNYSRIPVMNQLTNEMIAIANTLEIGRRLAIEHEHSRLALDSEMEALEEASKAGRALEIENIAPTLQSIANDETVLLRARRRAAGLINASSSKSQTSATKH